MSYKKSTQRAVKCLRNSQFGLSCGHFCLAFKLAANADMDSYKQLTHKWKSTFLYAFDRYVHQLQTNGDNETIVKAFNEAIDAFPECEDIYYNKGIHFFRTGCLSEAVNCFARSLALNPNYHLSHLCLENIKSSAIARWHYIMINDIKRNTAFKNAISRAVRNGFDTVLDIGSGSGLLSLYSVQSGAHRVYACEVSQMLCHLCRDVFETNGVTDQVILFNRMSTDLRIPQTMEKPASLVVTEVFDSALFGEHVLTTIHSALKNLLDPNHGMVIPNGATVYGILIESNELNHMFRVNRKEFGNTLISDNLIICVDLDESKYTTTDLSKVYDKKYLSQRFRIVDIDFNSIAQIERLIEKDFVFNVDVQCLTNGRLDAIGVWFDLKLIDGIDGIHISTEPPTELIGWEQSIYPLTTRPNSVEHKTQVGLSFTLNEDYLRLIDVKVDNKTDNQNDYRILKFNSELINYLNANNFHDLYIKAIENVIKSKSITKLIDINYFPISSLHFIDNQSLTQLLLVNDDNQMTDNIKEFIKVCKLDTNKIDLLDFDALVASDKPIENALVLTDLIESSGLMRSNVLEKIAYLKVYSLKAPVLMPFKVVVKGLLIQSEDIIMRSRLISDDKVHGFKIKSLINIFETEILQNIDLKKIEFIRLSHSFDLLEINFNQLVRDSDETNIEPNSDCAVNVSKSGRLDALLYYYELHLTEHIVIDSYDLGHNWHSAAYVPKQPISVNIENTIHISCVFTNGFLRFKELQLND